MCERFGGRVVIVTGGASGIGAAAAALFANEGASVVVSDIDGNDAGRVAAGIVSGGGWAVPAAGDVAVAADVDAIVGTAIAAYGRVDVLFSNAGIPSIVPSVVDLSEQEWEVGPDDVQLRERPHKGVKSIVGPGTALGQGWEPARRALFRYFLIVRLNLYAAERGPLLTATALANSYQLDALIAGGTGVEAPADVGAEQDPGWPTWRERSERLLTELYASRFARVSASTGTVPS